MTSFNPRSVILALQPRIIQHAAKIPGIQHLALTDRMPANSCRHDRSRMEGLFIFWESYVHGLSKENQVLSNKGINESEKNVALK